MNKVLNINLNGLIITIDEVAYNRLKSYIDGLHRHFGGTEGSAEIISDIETRIAELLQLKLTASYTVIQLNDVEEVITIMGNPSQMAVGDEEENTHQSHSDQSHTKYNESKKLRRDPRNKVVAGVSSGISNFLNIDPVFIRGLFLIALFVFGTGVLLYLILWIAMPEAKPGELPDFVNTKQKRLFRSSDNKMIGGVCSGAADYFGIDPVWIRLLFLIALFLYGSGVLLYIVLWLIIPQAVTSAQKLQMKGEPIDVNNIERVIRNTFNKGAKPATGFLSNLVSLFGQLFGFAFKTAGKIIGIMVIATALAVTGLLLFGLFYEQEQYNAIISSFSIKPEVLNYAKLAVTCFLTSFILGLFLLAYRLLSSKPVSIRYAGLINTILFIASVVFAVIAGVKYSSLVNTGQEVIERRTIYPTADTLYFEMAQPDVDDEVVTISSRKKKHWRLRNRRRRNNDINIVFTNGNHLPLISSQTLFIKPSLTDSIELKMVKEARGSGIVEAENIASEIQYNVKNEGNRFVFDRGILIGKETGYRYQQADITLSIPLGTVIIIKEHVVDMMRDMDYDMRTGTTYKVTRDGLACVDCESDKIIYNGEWDEQYGEEDFDIEISTRNGKTRKEEEIIIKQTTERDSAGVKIIEEHKQVGPIKITKTKRTKSSEAK